jgi:hypothetical protein
MIHTALIVIFWIWFAVWVIHMILHLFFGSFLTWGVISFRGKRLVRMPGIIFAALMSALWPIFLPIQLASVKGG